MIAFLFGRVLSAAVVVLGVSCMVFLLIHIVPGDPVEVMLGESARPADREALRHALKLDRPVLVQLKDQYAGLLRGDLGTSLHSKRPVVEMVSERLGSTFMLAVSALIVAVAVAVPLGVMAALRQGTLWDFGAMGLSMLGVSIPNFVAGPLLILVFSLGLGWFPVSGQDNFLSIVLPAITLGTAMAAILSRMIRSTLLETLGEDYVRTARAKGLSDAQVVVRHALYNASLPIITLVGLQLGTLLGGAVITEMIFAWPGVGQLTIESIQRRDYPLLQACVLTISLAYVVINTVTDLVYAWVDPRIRLGEDG
jgi:peptide/nickel transport system permease protein